jgi:hypothetical protein
MTLLTPVKPRGFQLLNQHKYGITSGVDTDDRQT